MLKYTGDRPYITFLLCAVLLLGTLHACSSSCTAVTTDQFMRWALQGDVHELSYSKSDGVFRFKRKDAKPASAEKHSSPNYYVHVASDTAFATLIEEINQAMPVGQELKVKYRD